ncbi:head-tail adaptor protein [Variovorax sp. WS11]|uniref:phage head closure protein n=1 Tax=Variovorax sp. WS11 TaxID=1105204 RepID=UPI000D0DD085|nr:phage head closure protein [Variovorax sp. WS11]NDZ12045.1 phage head closure protein [Variovorax sp. WS11]PSL83771.1 head-tail adaptor protein [Variovorax sp. WS11]
MEIGKLNRRVTIQQPGTVQDDIGEPVAGWVDVATVWANVRFLNGVETVKGDAPVSVARASIRVRRRTDVTAGMRAVLGSTIFDIRSVLDDQETRERIDLACETGANAG